MKRHNILAVMIALAMIASLCACGKDEAKDVQKNNEQTEVVEEQESVEEEKVVDDSVTMIENEPSEEVEEVDEVEEVTDDLSDDGEIKIDGDNTIFNEDGMLVTLDKIVMVEREDGRGYNCTASILCENNNSDNKILELDNMSLALDGVVCAEGLEPMGCRLLSGEQMQRDLYFTIRDSRNEYRGNKNTELEIQSLSISLYDIKVGRDSEPKTVRKNFKTTSYKDGEHDYGEKITEIELYGKMIGVYCKDTENYTIYTLTSDSDVYDFSYASSVQVYILQENNSIIYHNDEKTGYLSCLGSENALLLAIDKNRLQEEKKWMEISNDAELTTAIIFKEGGNFGDAAITINGDEIKTFNSASISPIDSSFIFEWNKSGIQKQDKDFSIIDEHGSASDSVIFIKGNDFKVLDSNEIHL